MFVVVGGGGTVKGGYQKKKKKKKKQRGYGCDLVFFLFKFREGDKGSFPF